jgi:hypothetical protein
VAGDHLGRREGDIPYWPCGASAKGEGGEKEDGGVGREAAHHFGKSLFLPG